MRGQGGNEHGGSPWFQGGVEPGRAPAGVGREPVGCVELAMTHRSASRCVFATHPTCWRPGKRGLPATFPWHLFSRPTPHAPRPTPHAAGRRDQRGQAMSRPFPAGYCLMPTPELGKSERSPISMIGLSLYYISMAPNRAILTAKTIRLSSL